jgi:hypothetical protein
MTDDRQRDRQPEDEPVVIGAGLHHVEDRVRAALADEASGIEPTHRLDTILAAAHSDDRRTDPRAAAVTSWRHRLLLPVAAAAVVAAVVGGVWVSQRPQTTPIPGGPSSSAVPTASSASGPATQTTTGPSTTGATTSPSAPAATDRISLPVYFVGPQTTGAAQLVLFREFIAAGLPDPVSGQAKVLTALRGAVAAPPAGSGYAEPWTGVTVEDVTVGSGEIAVTLSRGAQGLDATEGRLAVQQLVWTATAALSKGNVPVRFVLADGSTALAGDLTTGQTYTRPTGDTAVYEVLSPVWIDSPSRGAVLPAGPVTVTGVASTFEANVQWEILSDPSGASGSGMSGFATAEVAGPQRGAYRFTTPDPLPAGHYTLRVFETSAKDGSVSALAETTFTVR